MFIKIRSTKWTIIDCLGFTFFNLIFKASTVPRQRTLFYLLDCISEFEKPSLTEKVSILWHRECLPKFHFSLNFFLRDFCFKCEMITMSEIMINLSKLKILREKLLISNFKLYDYGIQMINFFLP